MNTQTAHVDLPVTLPFPIFDSVDHYHSRSWSSGPVRCHAQPRLTAIIKDAQNIEADWSPTYLEVADRFLLKYLKGESGPANTFNRFKVEIERFTLWLVIEHKKNPLELEASDITEYLEFLATPKSTWVSAYNTIRLTGNGDNATVNPDWRPFWARRPKGVKLPSVKSGDAISSEQRRQFDRELVDSYSPSLATIAASPRALSPFYNYLIDHQKRTETEARRTGDYSALISTVMNSTNPVPDAAKILRKQHLIPNPELAKGRSNSLTQRQWDFILEALVALKDDTNATELQRKKWTRSLFIMTFMKANMLRISEICRTSAFNPKMSDLRKVSIPSEDFEYWEYSFLGKGSVRRTVLLPEGVLPYLVDYRRSRDLANDYPDDDDHAPLLAHLKAKRDRNGTVTQEHPLTYNAARDQIQLVFNKTVKYMENKERELGISYEKDIDALKQASTHWLRHTGASMALDDGEDISSVSETLGHTNHQVTNQIYNGHLNVRKLAAAPKRKV